MNFFTLTTLPLSFSVVLLCSHCNSKKENSISASDAKILAAVHKAQSEMKMTDEQVEQSIESMTEVYHQINQSVDQGLITLDDVHDFPKKIKKLSNLMNEQGVLSSSSYLKILKEIEKGELDKTKRYLRFLISMGYKTHLNKKDKDYLEFASEVEKYAETDEALKKRLQRK